ncbi:MAG: tetratricopeptide repeat protein [Gallionella sp.]|nr:tetratricopeptide repeat protein [Gallionella sp.]
MSRKVKQHKAQTKPVSPHAMDSAVLAAEAGAALSASRYKEAIELYKELVKRERQPIWVDGLAACYAGRARDLAAKGMLKEALVLWRNRAQLCGKPLAEGPYFDWLFQAGEQKELFQLLADNTLPEATRTELETCLAATVLAAPDNALPALPADSALLRHRSLVLGALAAYHRGDFAAMGEQLQAIPFRSPYRDLKPALKALALLTTDAEAAQAAIARLPSTGPFERLAAVLRAAVLPDGGWLAALRDLNEDGRHLVLDIKGCPDALRPLLLELSKLGDTPAAASLLDTLLRHRRAVPEDKFIGLYHRLMPHLGRRLPKNPDYARLPTEKKTHITALAGELLGELEDAEDDWKKLAELLCTQPEQRLRAALIWRHMADLSRKNGPNNNAFKHLKKSLELDPEDRDSYLTVIRVLRSDNDLAQARAYLDKALPRFPKDAGVLLEAVEVALAGKAFKKAVGLAKQVLELDPINPQVRGLIGHALFSHARKQIKARNNPAACKELDAAEEWLRAPEDKAMLKLLRSFATEGQASDADAQLREAVADFGGALVGVFHLLLEANKVGLDPKDLLLRAGVDLETTPPAPEAVIALAQAMSAARDGEKTIRAALAPLRAPLKRAVKAKFSEADHLLVCEALQRSGEKELLLTYAEAALKRWPDRPVFVYFRVTARYGNDSYDIPDQDFDALEKALENARLQGDERTAQRILAVLDPMEDMSVQDPYPDDYPFNPFDGIPGSPRAMFELLLAIKGEKVFLDMVRNEIGKQAFNDLKQQFGGNQRDFTRHLIDMMVEDDARIKRQHPTDFLPPPIVPPPPMPRGKSRPPPENQKDLFDE